MRKPEHRYLTHDQVEDLAIECGYPSNPSLYSSHDTRANETYRLVVLFLSYTGVRFGEMAALRVARLDLRRQRAVIFESVTPVQGRGLVWGTTETHQRREVPIPRARPNTRIWPMSDRPHGPPLSALDSDRRRA